MREFAERLDTENLAVLDVRGAAEWEVGHLPGVENIPVGYLAERLDEIPRDRPLVVHCLGGGRSAIAASVLQREGFREVSNLVGGYQAWVAAGLPIRYMVPAAVERFIFDKGLYVGNGTAVAG